MTPMGKADWIYEPELGCHIPSCIVLKLTDEATPRAYRCGNGPLEGEQIETGDCGEHT